MRGPPPFCGHMPPSSTSSCNWYILSYLHISGERGGRQGVLPVGDIKEELTRRSYDLSRCVQAIAARVEWQVIG